MLLQRSGRHSIVESIFITDQRILDVVGPNRLLLRDRHTSVECLNVMGPDHEEFIKGQYVYVPVVFGESFVKLFLHFQIGYQRKISDCFLAQYSWWWQHQNRRRWRRWTLFNKRVHITRGLIVERYLLLLDRFNQRLWQRRRVRNKLVHNESRGNQSLCKTTPDAGQGN